MASVIINGDTSGSITLAAPAVAGTNTLTLPANTGTVITTGSNGQVIPKAALPTGSVLQVVNATYATQTSTTSSSYVTSNLTASITPTSSSSKILVLTTFNAVSASTGNLSSYYTLYRNSTNLFNSEGAFRVETDSASLIAGAISYYDSPATTSSTTYAVYMKSQNSSVTTYMAYGDATCSIILLEIAA